MQLSPLTIPEFLMADAPIPFDDGASYERYMGAWSQPVGMQFLDWLAMSPGARWLDVGCGNGAFTELVAVRSAPASLDGIDPSPAQLAFARTRPPLRDATFQQGDAMALPFPDDAFDVAVMPLVIFFVPEPARGVAEMVRVVRPGGTVAAYGWDLQGGGFPYASLEEELKAEGLTIGMPPSPDASQPEVLSGLWRTAGLVDVASRTFTVTRTYASFAEYWDIVRTWRRIADSLATLDAAAVARIEARMRAKLPADATGRITLGARAHAIRGVVAGG